jgi:hypothetical protein
MVLDLKKLKESGSCLKVISGRTIETIEAEAFSCGATQIIGFFARGVKIEAVCVVPGPDKKEKPKGKEVFSKPSKEEKE